jgi:hypothetical protein
MTYNRDYHYLKNLLKEQSGPYPLPESKARIMSVPFESHNCKILPGEEMYKCREHQHVFYPGYSVSETTQVQFNDLLLVNDSRISENRLFNYIVFNYPAPLGSRHAILLFHGLNEKNWDKYLPWAKTLAERTKSTVILFPIAFHMNRGRDIWGDSRTMDKVKAERLQKNRDDQGLSFLNTAISTRLHHLPQRFFWSGLQSYYDVIQMVNGIRSGEFSFLDKTARIDFFAYSIGAFLAEVLLMTNPEGLFTKSKLFILAGGPVFNRMSPITRYIIDSEANKSISSVFVDHLEKHLLTDERLSHYLQEHREGIMFRAMLNYNKMREERESRFMALNKQIYAIGLKKDTVVNPAEMVNTLKGSAKKIPIRVKVMDFPYKYSHENPFPVSDSLAPKVDEAFDKVFRLACRFLANKT